MQPNQLPYLFGFWNRARSKPSLGPAPDEPSMISGALLLQLRANFSRLLLHVFNEILQFMITLSSRLQNL